MSKLETIKSLPTARQLEVSMEALRQVTDSLQSDLTRMQGTLINHQSKMEASFRRMSEMIEMANRNQITAKKKGLRYGHFAVILLLAGMMGGLVVALGQQVVGELWPKNQVVQEAAIFGRIWQNATPQEREMMRQIANRGEGSQHQ